MSALEAPRSELQLKLVWLTVFRTVTTSLLLGAIAFRLIGRRPAQELSREDSLSFVVIGLVYGLTLIHGLLLRRGTVGNLAAYLQIAGDLVVASCLVYLTGGTDSPFVFTYSVAIVAASILLYQRGSLVALVGGCASFVLLVVALQSEWLRLSDGSPPPSPGKFGFVVFSNLAAMVLIAILAGYLSRQLSAAGGRLSEREADLRELAQTQQQILATMPAGLITCDASGRLTFANQAAIQILGDRVTESGVAIEELLPGVRSLMPRAAQREVVAATRGGLKTLGITVSPMSGGTANLLLVFQDLTELRRVEEELRRVDRLAALGRLSAQLAHEIRNPLAAMRGAAQMLGVSENGNESTKRLSNLLVRESDRLSGLVEDFLRFARPTTPQVRQIELKALVSETLEMLSTDPAAHGVTLKVDLMDARVRADPDQLRQVVINLMRNAFAAAGASGSVRVGLEQNGADARLFVWDSAGSILPEHMDRLFEPFFSTKSGGTGLGLSTAHSIVQAHHGKIEVRSSREGGTEFSVRLALVEEASDARLGG